MLIHSIDGHKVQQLEMGQVVALLKGQPDSMAVIRVSSHMEALRPSASPLTSFTEEAKAAKIFKFKECMSRKDFEVVVVKCVYLVGCCSLYLFLTRKFFIIFHQGLIKMESDIVELASSILDEQPDLRWV